MPSTPLTLPSGIPISDIHIDYINGNIIVGCVNRASADGINPLLSEEEKARLSHQSNVAHFRRRVLEMALANSYELSCTFTFPTAMDNDIDEVKKLIPWMRKHARCKGYKLHYLAVIAPKKEGGHWHWHMLVSGIPKTELEPITKDSKPLTENQKGRLWHQQLYHWRPFLDKYGSYHEIVRFGERDANGHIIDQLGKAKYISKQYNDVPAEFFPPPGTRKIRSDAKTVRPSRSARCYTTLEDLKDLFAKFGGTVGHWGGRLVLTEENAPQFLRELQAKSLFAESDLLIPFELSKKPAAVTIAPRESAGPASDG